MGNKTASVKDFRYGIPALIAAALSLIIFIVISGVSVKSVDITTEAIQLVYALVSLAGLLDCIRRNREEPIFKLAAEVPGKGQSIFQYDPNGKVAKAYEHLTREVLNIAAREKQARDTDAR